MAVRRAAAQDRPEFLNQGIYDSAEVGRLIHRDPDTIARWTVRRRGIQPLLEPQLDDLFSFLDLVSLYVISELRRRRVPRAEILAGGTFLAERLGTHRPYAHKRLATVGSSFFANLGEWVDIGRSGQGAFQSVVAPLVRPITYDANGLASIWHPHALVVIDPRVQTGTPCVEGTRVPTALVADLVEGGEERLDVADDFGLTVEAVEAAVDFEVGLDRAA